MAILFSKYLNTLQFCAAKQENCFTLQKKIYLALISTSDSASGKNKKKEEILFVRSQHF